MYYTNWQQPIDRRELTGPPELSECDHDKDNNEQPRDHYESFWEIVASSLG
jgi:hypothetical protein